MSYPAIHLPPPPTALDPEQEGCPFIIGFENQYQEGQDVGSCPNPVTAVCQLCALRCCAPHMATSDCPKSPESRHQVAGSGKNRWNLNLVLIYAAWFLLMALIALKGMSS